MLSKKQLEEKENELLAQGFIKTEMRVQIGRTYSLYFKIAEFVKNDVRLSVYEFAGGYEVR